MNNIKRFETISDYNAFNNNETFHPIVSVIGFSKHFIIAVLMLTIILTAGSKRALAQQDIRKYRIAKLEILPGYLTDYKIALAEHAKIAVQTEPGVLALQAVYDKAHPAMVTVFEVYASDSAYQSHLKTAHFLKYKTGTSKMVKSLELVEVTPIAIAIKQELIKNKD